jgi:uncharacterized membrane protein YebE (DUF533 family)
LDSTRKKLLKLLVALAWADGRVDSEEMEVIEAVLDTFRADAETAKEIREFAKTPRTLDDVKVDGVTADDAGLVLYQAVLLTFIDGEQSEKEIRLLEKFMEKVGLTRESAAPILERATARAKSLLSVLQEPD